MSGSLSGAEGFTTQEDQEVINRVEKQLKRRFAIGSQVLKDSTSFDLICLGRTMLFLTMISKTLINISTIR